MSKDTDRDAQRCPNDGQTLAWHLETNRDGRTNGAFLGCAFGAPSLPEFLLARLDEDEADAESTQRDIDKWHRERVATGRADGSQGSITLTGIFDTACDPARVLADVEAKRRIVEEHTPVDYGPLGMDSPNACHICGIDVGMSDWEYVRDSFPCVTLRALALPYADHPDYRAEWAL